MRNPSGCSMRGASASQPPRPRTPPRIPATRPVAAPVATIVSRRCFSVAPTAAIIPSCGRRRCAMTAKLAAAMSAIRNSTTVLTTSVIIEATRLSGTLPRGGDDPAGVAGWTEGIDARVARLHDHHDLVGLRERGRRQQHELVTEIARVLDLADDGALDAVEVDGRTDRGAERRGDPVRHRDLAVGGRVATRRAAPAGGDRTVRSDPGSGSRPGRPSPARGRCGGRSRRWRRTTSSPPRAWSSGSRRRGARSGRSGCRRRTRPGRTSARGCTPRQVRPTAAGDGHRQQREDQQVLTPVAPEQAHGPADDRPTRRHAAGGVGSAHRPTTGVRSDSGPGAGVD